MPVPFEYNWSPSGGFNPAAPLTGALTNEVYAGRNMVLISDGSRSYLEQWPGYGLFATDTGNTIASGTVAGTIGTNTVTGTGTKFRSELTEGQSIAIDGKIYVPTRIDSETSMQVTPKLANTLPGATVIAILRQIQELDTFIISMLRGSVIKLQQGHLLGVGRGSVRRNGAALPGAGWTLTDTPQVAVLDPLSGNYTPYRLGMNTPTLTTVTAIVGGGTKGMPAATFSVRIVPYKFATQGFNNPSDPVAVTLATAGDRVQVTFPTMDTANGQDGWLVYGTRSDATANARGGPWYKVKRLSSTEVAPGGGVYTLEWADFELTELLEFNCDPPPPASFIATLDGIPLLIGCYGPGRTLTGTATTAGPGSNVITGAGTLFQTELGLNRFVWIGTAVYRVLTITSNTSMTVDPTPAGGAAGLTIRSASEAPGPVVIPAKISGTSGGYNFDAYPAESAIAIDPPSNIIGIYAAEERIYCLTANSLAILERNTDPATSSIKPIRARPFWSLGVANPRSVSAVNSYLYAFTTNGATRSADFGDKVETEHTFAARVKPVMSTWDPAKVTVAYSAEYEAVCFMHADDGTRPGGTARYGTMLMYMLQSQAWSPPLRMEDLTDSNPVYATSTATLQNRMYFASPSALGITQIYQLAVPSGGVVGETFVAPPPTDMGVEEYDKFLRWIKVTAGRNNSAAAVVDIYKCDIDEAVPIDNINAGTGGDAQVSYTLNTPAMTTRLQKLYVNNAQVFLPRIRLALSGNVGARVEKIFMKGHTLRLNR